MRRALTLHLATFGLLSLGTFGCGAKKPVEAVVKADNSTKGPVAYAPIKEQKKSYLFGWQDYKQDNIPVRGGTTKGGAVTMQTEPSSYWKALNKADLKGKEKDQAAIRAFAGDYKASFDFLETVVFGTEKQPAAPYRSWGTERVYIVEDKPGYVNLQHVMVMYFIDKEGKTQGPMVMKHWRQEWEYEPESMHVYIGNKTWETRALSEAQRAGKWVQTAYQVDDSPRYSLIGTWEHHQTHSSWSSETGWRPLPRREYSVRKDYQVLDGSNRLTILPTGWVHEQDNLKRILNNDGSPNLKEPFIAREIGVNRYDLLVDFDFSAGDDYWQKTQPYWSWVRDEWKATKASIPKMTLASKCNEQPAFYLFFGLASEVEKGQISDPAEIKQRIKKGIDCIAKAAK